MAELAALLEELEDDPPTELLEEIDSLAGRLEDLASPLPVVGNDRRRAYRWEILFWSLSARS
jgi:hypothetical protein